MQNGQPNDIPELEPAASPQRQKIVDALLNAAKDVAQGHVDHIIIIEIAKDGGHILVSRGDGVEPETVIGAMQIGQAQIVQNVIEAMRPRRSPIVRASAMPGIQQ